MSEQSKSRVPLVPGPSTPMQPMPAGFQQPRPAEEQGLPGYMLDKLDRERAMKPNGPLVPRPSTGKVAKAIASVMRDVGTIEKRGHNKFHDYRYALMEDVLHAVAPLMGKNGLAIIQNEIERAVVETRCLVVYEFTVLHESGESLPPARGTGMAIARDSKGSWDDKAINKCHTAARKYFLMSLFQLPAGDFDDADGDEGSSSEPKSVPGPSAVAEITQPEPHKIMVRGQSAEAWGEAFLKAVGKATTTEEIAAWDRENDTILQKMHDQHGLLYERMRLAVERRLNDLTSAPTDPGLAMPDPHQDPGMAINWVAQQLADCKAYETAEAFWNQVVAPREVDFAPTDFDLLLAEWQRTETRLAPNEEAQ